MNWQTRVVMALYKDRLQEMAEMNRSEYDLAQDFKNEIKHVLDESVEPVPHEFITAIDFYKLAEIYWEEFS